MKNKSNSNSLKDLYEYLRQFHLSESLYLIGAINSVLKFGLAKEGRYRNDIPKYILQWLERIPQNKSTLLNIYLGSTRLARFLLLSNANDYRKKRLELPSNTLANAIDFAADLYDQELETELKQSAIDITNNILGRISFWQFPLQEDRLTQIGRAYLLFVVIPQEMNLPYNFDEKLKEYFEMDCFQFMVTGFALWLKCNGTFDYELKIEIAELEGIVNGSSQRTFLKLSSGTPKEYKESVRGENWKEPNKLYDIYYLDPLIKMPAIAVDFSLKFRPDTFVVPQPKYLLDRASTGIFFLLADKEQEIAKDSGKSYKNPFRAAFGDIYRKYVLKQLQQISPNKLLIDLDNDFKPDKGCLLPDFAIIDDNTCILVEVKTSLLKISSRAFFNEVELENEIKAGNLNKAISQLSEFRDRILNGAIVDSRLKNVKHVINLLISYEDIYVLNSYLLPLLKKHYGNNANNLQLGTISDIDAIGNLLLEDLPIGKILSEKIADPDKYKWALMQFLMDYHKKDNKVLKQSFNDFMNRLGLKKAK